MFLLLSLCVLFILQEVSLHLDNIFEKGKGDTINNHEKEEVCKIHPLIVLVWNFQNFPRSKTEANLVFLYIHYEVKEEMEPKTLDFIEEI